MTTPTYTPPPTPRPTKEQSQSQFDAAVDALIDWYGTHVNENTSGVEWFQAAIESVAATAASGSISPGDLDGQAGSLLRVRDQEDALEFLVTTDLGRSLLGAVTGNDAQGLLGIPRLDWVEGPAVNLSGASVVLLDNIPDDAREVEIQFFDVENGDRELKIQVGDGASFFVESGYISASTNQTTSATSSQFLNSGFLARGENQFTSLTGVMHMDRWGGGRWKQSHQFVYATGVTQGAGSVDLTTGLNRVRIVSGGAIDNGNFTDGTATVRYR